MELQFETRQCRFQRRLTCQVISQEETQELHLPDAMPDAGRILACWGQAMLRGKQWRANDMVVSGGVMVWVLYAPEDGSEPRRLDTWIPFQARWDLPPVNRDGIIIAEPRLTMLDGRCVSPRKLLLRAGLETRGEAWIEETAQIPVADQTMPDVELLRETYTPEFVREIGEKTFQADADLALPEHLPQMGKLIRYDFTPAVAEEKVAGDKGVFRGSGRLHLLYTDADGVFRTWQTEVPFSQLADLEREYGREAAIQTTLVPTSLELETGEGRELRLRCSMVAQYRISEPERVELVRDAYSLHRETDPKLAELCLPAVLEHRTEHFELRQERRADSGELLDLAFYTGFPQRTGQGDDTGISVGGVFQILCMEQDGTLRGSAVRAEGTIPLAADTADITASVVQWTASGEQNALCSAMRVETTALSDSPVAVVSALELGQDRQADPHRPSLIVRRIGEEGSVWNLAKHCGSSVSAIRNLNRLSDEPAENQMLLIPIL